MANAWRDWAVRVGVQWADGTTDTHTPIERARSEAEAIRKGEQHFRDFEAYYGRHEGEHYELTGSTATRI